MDYQELFNYMRDEHNVILLDTDLHDIVKIVNKMQMDDARKNIIERIEGHKTNIVLWENQLASANNIVDSEACVKIIKSIRERESELEIVLKYCL